METDQVYEIVYEAVAQALADASGGADIRLSRRMVGGIVIFRDEQGRTVKEIDAFQLFRKVTSVREKLRTSSGPSFGWRRFTACTELRLGAGPSSGLDAMRPQSSRARSTAAQSRSPMPRAKRPSTR